MENSVGMNREHSGKAWFAGIMVLLLCLVLTQLYDSGGQMGLMLSLRNALGVSLFSVLILASPLVYSWMYFHSESSWHRVLAALLLPLVWIVKETVASYAVLGPPGFAVLIFLSVYLALQVFLIGLVDLVCRLIHRRRDASVALFGWHSLLIVIPLVLYVAVRIVLAIFLG